MNKLVSQEFDDYEVFDDKTQFLLLQEVIGQKIEKIFARHDRDKGSYFIITLENGKELSIGATTGDFNAYLSVCVFDIKEKQTTQFKNYGTNN
jgi:hypothetical protein